MELDQFHRELILDVRATADVNSSFVSTEFVKKCCEFLVDAEEIRDVEEVHIEGVGVKGKRLLLHAYSFDEVDGTLNLIVSNFQNVDGVIPVNSSDLKRLYTSARNFLEDAFTGALTTGLMEEAVPGFSAALFIYRSVASISKVKVFIVTNELYRGRVPEWADDTTCGLPIEAHIWDVDRFLRSYMSKQGREDIVIDLTCFHEKGLLAIEADADMSGYSAFLTVLEGSVLAKIYDLYGSRLLEGNVRSFLSTRGKINGAIQTSLKDEPQMFFAYNNGISATCESIYLSIDRSRILEVRNLQIVNGGQTTASLAFAYRAGIDLSRVRVQMKLCVVSNEDSVHMVPLIARYANSQNKVNEADFFSNHPYHVRLEELSRKIWTPALPGMQYGTRWFFERARGQFANEQIKLTLSEKNKHLIQNPKAQLLTKTDVAKFEMSWRGFPHKVSLGAQKNFLSFASVIAKEWDEGSDKYDERYYKYIVCLAILFKSVERMVPKQPWYQGGYRANVVTYSLAMLRYMIVSQADGCDLDFDRLWRSQSLWVELEKLMIEIMTASFQVLTSNKRTKQNVTEWAKTESCWKMLQDKKITLNDLVLQENSPRYIALRDEISPGFDPNGYGVFAMKKVAAIQPSEWEALYKWANHSGQVTEGELKLIATARRIPRFFPKVDDCQSLLKLRDIAVKKGFEFLDAS